MNKEREDFVSNPMEEFMRSTHPDCIDPVRMLDDSESSPISGAYWVFSNRPAHMVCPSGFIKSMVECMQSAIDEDPESAKNWSPEELFEKGANWAGRHVIITEKDADS